MIAGLVDNRFQHFYREPGLDGHERWGLCGLEEDPVRVVVGDQARPHLLHSASLAHAAQ